MIWFYLFIAFCTYMALPRNDLFSPYTDQTYIILCVVMAIFWPATLTTAFIRKFFGLDR